LHLNKSEKKRHFWCNGAISDATNEALFGFFSEDKRMFKRKVSGDNRNSAATKFAALLYSTELADRPRSKFIFLPFLTAILFSGQQ